MLFTFPGMQFYEYTAQLTNPVFGASGRAVERRRVLLLYLPDVSGTYKGELPYLVWELFWSTTQIVFWFPDQCKFPLQFAAPLFQNPETKIDHFLRPFFESRQFDEMIILGGVMIKEAEKIVTLAHRSDVEMVDKTPADSPAHARICALTRSHLSLVAG